MNFAIGLPTIFDDTGLNTESWEARNGCPIISVCVNAVTVFDGISEFQEDIGIHEPDHFDNYENN